MRWLLCGATGRMGRETARLIAAGGEEAVAFDARTAESGDVRGDVMVDFSVPEATEGNLAAALRLGCPLVLGTTGQGPREAEMIGRAAEKIPILWCANFSRGAALLAQLAATACAGWEGESALVEQHRAGKRDCPSGTAEMIGKSILYVLNSLKKVTVMGGDRVVVHPATQGKLERKEAVDIAKRNLTLLANEVEAFNGQNMKVCLETMGKLAQIGDAEETADFCAIAPFFYPCIDFGHLNARTFGSLKTTDDYLRVFDAFLNKLPFEKVKNTHIHFSKIMYGSKGEIKHLTFEDTVYGPEFEPLCEAILKLGLEPYIICESDGTQAEDTVTMKNIYLSRI
ncbi:MAG: TIM barrel protein [Clostridia bacterium]|nr:TIM barrel protein [Clostridia bacterium]